MYSTQDKCCIFNETGVRFTRYSCSVLRDSLLISFEIKTWNWCRGLFIIIIIIIIIFNYHTHPYSGVWSMLFLVSCGPLNVWRRRRRRRWGARRPRVLFAASVRGRERVCFDDTRFTQSYCTAIIRICIYNIRYCTGVHRLRGDPFCYNSIRGRVPASIIYRINNTHVVRIVRAK